SFGVRSMETVQQHSADRRSTYLAALTLEIERKLQKVRVPILGSDFRLVFLQALISPRQRPELLQQLFADVALEVEDRARERKKVKSFMNPRKAKRRLSRFSNLGMDVTDADSCSCYLKSLLKILKCCYVMDLPLFKVLPMFSGIFICSPVVRIDIQTNRKRFFPLFSLQKLKVEPVLLHYLSRMSALKGLELRMTTSTRLKACLYSFTSPGGPMYPTRVVRHAAWDTLDLLFPVGQYPRHIISLFFRLLYPWYWPSSCWNFIMTCVRTVVFYVLRIIGSSWENMRKPKDS
ncbi:hypothetical protein BHE74_00024657, partial [Ensete ventricosum]